MKKIEEILAQCIEEVRSGKASMADCLNRYTDMRRELEPLLRIALSIKEPPDIRPSDAFKIRARVNLMEHIHMSRAVKKTSKSAPRTAMSQAWYAGWLKVATIVIAVILAISTLGAGTAYASQGSIPGDTLYVVKLGTEQVQRLLITNDAQGVNLELEFANTRLKEIESVAQKRPDEITVAVTGYERNLNMAIARAELVKNGGVPTSILETLASAISSHLSILDELEDSVPEAFKDSISGAGEIAVNEHMKVLRIMAKEDPLRATKINMETMQGRLNRAKIESEKDNAREVEKALQQFGELRRFGEEISGIARGLGYDTRAVDELNARATADHLEALGYIYGMVPEGGKGAVEEAMGTSIEEHGQAVKSLQQQGALDDLPEEPPLPDGIPDEVKKKLLKPESKDSGNGKW